MSNEKKTKRGTASRAGKISSSPRVHDQADRDVGHALRSVYATTVNEEIPSELLDLLGKLS